MESTNIAVGRGSRYLFRRFGAPWVDNYKLTKQLKLLKVPNVNFKKIRFKAQKGIYKGKMCYGFSMKIKDYSKVNFMELNLTIMKFFFDNYKKYYDISACKNMIGDMLIIEYFEDYKSVKEILAIWDKYITQYKEKRKKYLLYIDPIEEEKKKKRKIEKRRIYVCRGSQ